MISAIPRVYKGVKFRSTLESDWAYNLDQLGITWQYEPEALDVDGTWYRPDFYLPDIRTYLEVKGNHDERIDKTRRLSIVLSMGLWESNPPGDGPRVDPTLVVIGRPAVGGQLTWTMVKPYAGFHDAKSARLGRCDTCQTVSFYEDSYGAHCRWCGVPIREADRDLWVPWQPLPIELRE